MSLTCYLAHYSYSKVFRTHGQKIITLLVPGLTYTVPSPAPPPTPAMDNSNLPVRTVPVPLALDRPPSILSDPPRFPSSIKPTRKRRQQCMAIFHTLIFTCTCSRVASYGARVIHSSSTCFSRPQSVPGRKRDAYRSTFLVRAIALSLSPIIHCVVVEHTQNKYPAHCSTC